MSPTELKNGPIFTASGIVHRAAHGLDEVDVALLDRGAALVGVGGDEVDVQLERVGAGVLDQARVLDPAAEGDAVEAADHGIELLAAASRCSQVGVGAGRCSRRTRAGR